MDEVLCGTGKGCKRKANLSWGRLQKKNVWACKKAQMFGEAGREKADLGGRLFTGWLRQVAETFLFSCYKREAGGSWRCTFWSAVKAMILENFWQPVLGTVSEVVMGKWRCSKYSSSPQPERFFLYWEILWGLGWSWECLPFKGKPRLLWAVRFWGSSDSLSLSCTIVAHLPAAFASWSMCFTQSSQAVSGALCGYFPLFLQCSVPSCHCSGFSSLQS